MFGKVVGIDPPLPCGNVEEIPDNFVVFRI